MSNVPEYPWKNQRAGYLEALDYIKGRQRGVINSIRTPWSKFNDATIDGLEWNTINVIAGRPGSLKTLIKDQIIKKSFDLNPKEIYRVLEFQLEMLARTSAIREFTGVVKKSYKHLCSAEGQMTDEDIVKCHEHAKTRVKFPIDTIENAPTVEEFERIVDAYMEVHSFVEDGVKYYTKTIITVDHSILLAKGPGEKDIQDTLQKFGKCLTKLKKKYPIIFIILSQLNRNVDTQDRSEEGKYGNLINESDIFGSDALLMHCDFLVGLDRPAKRKIRIYGPDRYIIDDISVVVINFLKCRNGDTRMSFFKVDFNKMEIIETEPPPTQKSRVSTI